MCDTGYYGNGTFCEGKIIEAKRWLILINFYVLIIIFDRHQRMR